MRRLPWILLATLAARAASLPGQERPEARFAPLDLPPGSLVRTADGRPGPDWWQQRVDWKLAVRLDPETPGLRARGRMTYHNASPLALDHLWLLLDQNLFRPDSRGARLPGSTVWLLAGTGKEGGVVLESLAREGRELDVEVDGTRAFVSLPEPIPPGGSADFELAWSLRLPRNGVERTGWEAVREGVVFQVAQWFPRPAKFDDVHGWNTLPYLGEGEFYSDFGDWEVAITVPAGHVVAATGELQNPEEVLEPEMLERWQRAGTSRETVLIRSAEEAATAPRDEDGGEKTWRFRARGVRGFAWASSRAFLWDGASLDGVRIQSFYPEEALPLWSEATEMARFSIGWNSRLWYPYPWPVANNVNGPVFGMEYPMIVFCEERRREFDLYDVIDHEFGHQWMPMLVNTDERRYAWMDEGFNTFWNRLSQKARFGYSNPALEPRAQARHLAFPGQNPVMTRPDHMRPGELGFLAYEKPALALSVLREVVLGPERFDRAFRGYLERWAGKSPQPADFFRTMEDLSGEDLAWFWRSWFLEPGFLDQSLEEVTPSRDGSRVRLTVATRGGLLAPVLLELTFDGGRRMRHRLEAEAWLHGDRFSVILPTGGGTLLRAEVDPDHLLPDLEPENNLWRKEEGKANGSGEGS